MIRKSTNQLIAEIRQDLYNLALRLSYDERVAIQATVDNLNVVQQRVEQTYNRANHFELLYLKQGIEAGGITMEEYYGVVDEQSVS